MSNNFGLKLGIEGEKQFKDALRDINQSFKVLASEMQLVSSQFDKNDKSVQSVTERNAVLNKEIEAQKNKISTLKSALDNASDSFGDTDKRTQNWQIQLNKAQAELNGMERELAENEKSLKSEGKALDETGKDMNSMGKETKNLGGEMEETGKKTSVFGDVLKASLAADAIKAGLTAIVDLVKSVGAAVKDYVAEGMDMATAAAQSQTLLTQVMRNTMGASDDQVQSMIRLTEQQEKVGVVSKNAQVTALAEMASFVERKEAMEDMLPIMNDYIAYQYGTTASADQARNVATALGKAIQGNIDGLAKQGFTLSQNEKEWFKTASEAERVAFVIDMVSESMGGVNEALAATDAGKMGNLLTVMQNTQIAVGTMANEFKAQIMGQMLPSISSLLDAFLGVLHGEGSIEDMASAFDSVFNEVSNIIHEFLPTVLELGINILTAVVTGIANNIDVIVEAGQSIMNALLDAVMDLLPIIMEAGTDLLFGLLNGIIENLPKLAETAVNIVTTLVEGIEKALPDLIPAGVEMITLIVKTLIDNLPMLLNAALELITGLAKGLLDAIPVLIEALPDIINAIVTFLLDSIPTIIETGIELLVSLIEALPSIITTIVAAIPKIIEGLVTAIIGSIPKIVDSGVKLIVSLIQNLPTIISEIIKAIPQIISSLVEAIIGSIPQLVEAGIKLFISLIQNLPMIIWQIIQAIPQIISGIVDAFTSYWGVMGEIGLNLIRSLWQGISDAGAWLRDQIGGFFGGVVDSIKNFFGISSPSTLFMGIGENMAEGLGIGFGEEMNRVGRKMRNAIPTDFTLDANISGGYSMDAISGSGSAGGIVNNFQIHGLTVREEADIDKIANALFRKQQQARRGLGVAFA